MAPLAPPGYVYVGRFERKCKFAEPQPAST